MLCRSSLALAFATITLAPAASAEDPAPASLSVFPPEIHLQTKRDRQSVVVQAIYPDGLTRDVRGQAKLNLSGAPVAKLEKNVLLPAADGSASLKVEFGGKAVDLPVEVKDSAGERPISFRLDVMPVFMKAGCNSGSCHGSARGKDG